MPEVNQYTSTGYHYTDRSKAKNDFEAQMNSPFGGSQSQPMGGPVYYGSPFHRPQTYASQEIFSPGGELRGLGSMLDAQQNVSQLEGKRHLLSQQAMNDRSGRFGSIGYDPVQSQLAQTNADLSEAKLNAQRANQYANYENSIRARNPGYAQNEAAQALGYQSAAEQLTGSANRQQQLNVLSALLSGMGGILNPPGSGASMAPLAGLLDTNLNIRDNANNPIGNLMSYTRPASNRYGAAS